MSEDIILQVGPDQLDAILKYLPIFEQKEYKFGAWVMEDGAFPHFAYSPEVEAFMHALETYDFIISFDWGQWKESTGDAQWTKKAVQKADLLTLCKMLTIHIRSERFNKGHLASVLQNGHIVDVLHRLKEIRKTME